MFGKMPAAASTRSARRPVDIALDLLGGHQVEHRDCRGTAAESSAISTSGTPAANIVERVRVQRATVSSAWINAEDRQLAAPPVDRHHASSASGASLDEE